MGNVSGSTFYMFLGVLVIYLIGVSIYTLVQKIKKTEKPCWPPAPANSAALVCGESAAAQGLGALPL